MTSTSVQLFAHVAALALLLLPGATSGYSPPPDDPVIQVDNLFGPWTSLTTPGCAIGIAEGGRPLMYHVYGMADLEHDVRILPTTVFEAGSVSKQLTAAAVLLLEQQGKLALTDDVRKYLPELRVKSSRHRVLVMPSGSKICWRVKSANQGAGRGL